MTPDPDALAWVRDQVTHRVACHRAALAHADALGWPHILSDQVHATQSAEAEAVAILELIEAELNA